MGVGKSKHHQKPAASIITLYSQAICVGDHHEALVYAASRASVPPTVTLTVQGIGRFARLPPLTCVRVLGRASLMFWVPAGLAPGDFEFRVTSSTDQAIGFLRGVGSSVVLNKVVRLYRGQHHSNPVVQFPSGQPASAFDTIEVLLPGCDPMQCFREADGAMSWDAALPAGRYSYQLRIAPRRRNNGPGPFLTDAPIPSTAVIGRRATSTVIHAVTSSPAASTLDVFGSPDDPGTGSERECCPSCLTQPVGVLLHDDHYVCQGCLEGWTRSCLQVHNSGRGFSWLGGSGPSPTPC